MTLMYDSVTAKCKGDQIRGFSSIADPLVCIDLLRMTTKLMNRKPDVMEIGLVDVYQY